MNETVETPLPADDLAPLPVEQSVEQQPEATTAPQATAETEEEGTVSLVPVGVVKALREENKALKVKAERADALEQENAAFRPLAPYAQFLQQNPHLLQQQAPQPQQQPAPQVDPLVEATAKRYDLYTADGKLDLERATAIVEDQRRVAREEAERVLQPVQQQTHTQQLQQNLAWMAGLKDADGRALEQSFIEDTVKSIYGALPKTEALKVLADPQVAQIVGMVALGRQAMTKKSAPQPPTTAPLVVESAGGGSGPVFNDASRELFKKAGISEKDATASAKRFENARGKHIPLE